MDQCAFISYLVRTPQGLYRRNRKHLRLPSCFPKFANGSPSTSPLVSSEKSSFMHKSTNPSRFPERSYSYWWPNETPFRLHRTPGSWSHRVFRAGQPSFCTSRANYPKWTCDQDPSSALQRLKLGNKLCREWFVFIARAATIEWKMLRAKKKRLKMIS